MSLSSALSQRIATILLFAAPVGLVHCGDDDGGGSPAATGGTGGAVTGGTAGKTTGGSAPTGGAQTTTGGTNTGGVTATGGKGGSGGKGGAPVTEAGADAGGAAGGEELGGAGGGGGAAGGAGGDDGEGGEGGEAGGGAAEDQALHSILIGTFAPLPDYDGEEITGQALLVRTAEGETRVSVQVLGLDDEVEYPVHVHNQPCEFLAGTHYKFDPAGDDDEDNEIWPGFTTDADGIGVSEVVVDHLARGDALAVVVHDPDADNAKMACADLTLDSDATLTAKGSFASFAQADDPDEEIAGSVEFVRSEDGTEITFSISGLGEEPEYMSHVHALPCDVADAGGHYKIDPTETDTVEENELWLDLGNTGDGEAEDSVSSEHRARLDAQSVVLHRMDEDTALKVACADLTVENYPPILVDGTGTVLEAAEGLGLDDLQALGSLRRSLDGRTRVRVSALGLSPNTEYPVHVHSLPCSVSNGGPHYKIDTGEEDTVEENELWLTLSANAEGEATAEASFEHTARADARAIVIHESENNERLVCIDLRP